MEDTDKTYWNNNREFSELADKLAELIPSAGEVANPQTNKYLEKYRIASNYYYDLFNNGLGNRASEFRKVFGFAGTWIAKSGFPFCEKLEQKMDEIVLLASNEQGFITAPEKPKETPDSHLIASAPEMLKALKQASEYCDLREIGEGGLSVQTIVDNAIAKAEGVQ